MKTKTNGTINKDWLNNTALLHHFNYLSINGNARNMDLCFWGAKVPVP